jgi:hypothetical protein
LTLTAGAGFAHGQSASVVVINENGAVSTNATSGAATWISPSAFGAKIAHVAADLEQHRDCAQRAEDSPDPSVWAMGSPSPNPGSRHFRLAAAGQCEGFSGTFS